MHYQSMLIMAHPFLLINPLHSRKVDHIDERKEIIITFKIFTAYHTLQSFEGK